MSNNEMTLKDKLKAYTRTPGSLIVMLLVMLSAILTFAVLIFLIVYVVVHGVPYLKPSIFSLHYTSENASLMPALINTVIMTFLSLLIAVPFGIFSAIFLVEYAKRGNKFVEVIRLTTETLQGIPSIVYGLFGMLFFVTTCGWGFSILAGAFTLAIMVLPLIMRSTEEALKAVPDSYREGSFGLGAGKLRTVFRIVLPSAVPGILAGVILAIGRIVGETAALIYTAGTVAKVPSSVFGSGRTLAVHMYNLSSEGLYMNQAYATAVVLLVLVVIFGGRNLGFGTLANMFLIGYFVDFFTWIWNRVLPADFFTTLPVRIAVLIPSVILFILTAALYMDVDMGTAPYDAIPIIISGHLPKVPFKVIRIAFDFSVTMIGFSFGGKIGAMTVIMILALGPVIQWLGDIMKKHFPALTGEG